VQKLHFCHTVDGDPALLHTSKTEQQNGYITNIKLYSPKSRTHNIQ